MPKLYSGCVYKDPPARGGPQGVEDLSSYALERMVLTGLPVKESHSGDTIGSVTEEWSDPSGSKHVTFSINGEEHPVVEMGLKTQILNELSLSHVVGSPPVPLEVSVCSRGRRPGTVISRQSPEEYKRMTFLQEQSTENETTNPAPTLAPIVMASNNAMDPANQSSLPAAVSPAVAAAQAQAQTQGSALQEPESQGQGQATGQTEDQTSSAVNLAATDPNRYMEIFRSVIDKLDEGDKKIFIDRQLEDMKQRAEIQQELDKAKAESAKMQASHQANLETTMRTIRNFFIQGADQNAHDGMTNESVSALEGALKANPELQAPIGQLVQCAARRTTTAESNFQTHQKATEQSAAEKELFDRMRGVMRDQAEPTYDYHGFEQTTNKRPLVSQNANAATAPPAKRAKTNSFEAELALIAGGMRSSLPTRPGNIGAKEQFPAR